MLAGNSLFLFFGVTGNFDDLQSVQERRGKSVQNVGRCQKEDMG